MKIAQLSHSALYLLGVAAMIVSVASVKAEQTHKAKISSKRAETVALKKYKGGKLNGKTELEHEGKAWEYAVMVSANGKTHEVMVNADSGKIDSEETVTAKEEAAEKKAESAAKKHPRPGK